jgi:hypothetical protein
VDARVVPLGIEADTDTRARPGLLSRVPGTSIDFWTQPERIDTLEWFGSPEDMCRAFAGLSAPHDPHVAAALSLNDGGIGLPHADYPALWFKGGPEPGVLTFNYLARGRSGGLVAASLMLWRSGPPAGRVHGGPGSAGSAARRDTTAGLGFMV